MWLLNESESKLVLVDLLDEGFMCREVDKHAYGSGHDGW